MQLVQLSCVSRSDCTIACDRIVERDQTQLHSATAFLCTRLQVESSGFKRARAAIEETCSVDCSFLKYVLQLLNSSGIESASCVLRILWFCCSLNLVLVYFQLSLFFPLPSELFLIFVIRTVIFQFDKFIRLLDVSCCISIVLYLLNSTNLQEILAC